MIKSNKNILISLLILWFFVRVVILFFIEKINLFEVHDIAVNMVKKGEMVYFLNGQMNYNYQFPVYPSLLYLIYQVFGIIPKAAIILNITLHTLAVFFSYKAFYWFTQNANSKIIKQQGLFISFISSLAVLFHPMINYYTMMIIHPFSLSLLFLMFYLYRLTEYFKNQTSKNFILIIISYGLALLDRTSSLVYIVPLFIFLMTTQSVFYAFRKTVLVLFTGLLFLLPWIYRNYTIYDTISINSSFGQNLWLGIQTETEGSAYLSNNNTYYSLISNQEWLIISKLNSVEQSAYFQEKYVKTIKKTPIIFFKMYLIKLKNFWFFRNNIGTEYSSTIKRYLPIYFIGYSMILLLTLTYFYKDRKISMILLGLPLGLSLFQAFFYVETRHRIIIEPLLIFMAICSVFIICSTLKQKHDAVS